MLYVVMPVWSMHVRVRRRRRRRCVRVTINRLRVCSCVLETRAGGLRFGVCNVNDNDNDNDTNNDCCNSNNAFGK